MSPTDQILFFLSFLGAFNGLLLSGYFLFFSKTKTLANKFLGLLLLALSLRIGKSVFLFFYEEIPYSFIQLGLSACFFLGPFLFFSLKSAIGQVKKPPLSWKVILAVNLLVIVGVGLSHPYEGNRFLWKCYIVNAIYFQWFGFVVASFFEVMPLLKKVRNDELKPNEKFILYVFLGNVLVWMGYVLAAFRAFQGAYITGAVAFSFILYFVILSLLYRKKTDDLFNYESTKYNQKKIQPEEATVLIERLEHCLMGQEAYKNADLKLHDLAHMMHISGHQLSQLLNDNLGKSFSSYINEYRIQKACAMIAIDDRFTLEAIGYEVGFSSKSTFFATFKKITGTTPLAYKANKTG